MSEILDLSPKDCKKCGKKTTGGEFCSVKCWQSYKEPAEVTTRCPYGLNEYDCWYCEEAKERHGVK